MIKRKKWGTCPRCGETVWLDLDSAHRKRPACRPGGVRAESAAAARNRKPAKRPGITGPFPLRVTQKKH